MKWLARLKEIEIVPKVEATEPTKPSQESKTGGFVGFVAPVLASVKKIGGDSPAANDPAPAPKNGRDADTFTARLARFTAKDVIPDDAAQLANKLVMRDSDLDDRRLCLECSHLSGYAGSWRCRDWQRAGIAIQARDAGLPGELVRTLQRCDGFTTAI